MADPVTNSPAEEPQGEPAAPESSAPNNFYEAYLRLLDEPDPGKRQEKGEAMARVFLKQGEDAQRAVLESPEVKARAVDYLREPPTPVGTTADQREYAVPGVEEGTPGLSEDALNAMVDEEAGTFMHQYRPVDFGLVDEGGLADYATLLPRIGMGAVAGGWATIHGEERGKKDRHAEVLAKEFGEPIYQFPDGSMDMGKVKDAARRSYWRIAATQHDVDGLLDLDPETKQQVLDDSEQYANRIVQQLLHKGALFTTSSPAEADWFSSIADQLPQSVRDGMNTVARLPVQATNLAAYIPMSAVNMMVEDHPSWDDDQRSTVKAARENIEFSDIMLPRHFMEDPVGYGALFLDTGVAALTPYGRKTMGGDALDYMRPAFTPREMAFRTLTGLGTTFASMIAYNRTDVDPRIWATQDRLIAQEAYEAGLTLGESIWGKDHWAAGLVGYSFGAAGLSGDFVVPGGALEAGLGGAGKAYKGAVRKGWTPSQITFRHGSKVYDEIADAIAGGATVADVEKRVSMLNYTMGPQTRRDVMARLHSVLMGTEVRKGVEADLVHATPQVRQAVLSGLDEVDAILAAQKATGEMDGDAIWKVTERLLGVRDKLNDAASGEPDKLVKLFKDAEKAALKKADEGVTVQKDADLAEYQAAVEARREAEKLRQVRTSGKKAEHTRPLEVASKGFTDALKAADNDVAVAQKATAKAHETARRKLDKNEERLDKLHGQVDAEVEALRGRVTQGVADGASDLAAANAKLAELQKKLDVLSGRTPDSAQVAKAKDNLLVVEGRTEKVLAKHADKQAAVAKLEEQIATLERQLEGTRLALAGKTWKAPDNAVRIGSGGFTVLRPGSKVLTEGKAGWGKVRVRRRKGESDGDYLARAAAKAQDQGIDALVLKDGSIRVLNEAARLKKPPRVKGATRADVADVRASIASAKKDLKLAKSEAKISRGSASKAERSLATAQKKLETAESLAPTPKMKKSAAKVAREVKALEKQIAAGKVGKPAAVAARARAARQLEIIEEFLSTGKLAKGASRVLSKSVVARLKSIATLEEQASNLENASGVAGLLRAVAQGSGAYKADHAAQVFESGFHQTIGLALEKPAGLTPELSKLWDDVNALAAHGARIGDAERELLAVQRAADTDFIKATARQQAAEQKLREKAATAAESMQERIGGIEGVFRKTAQELRDFEVASRVRGHQVHHNQQLKLVMKLTGAENEEEAAALLAGYDMIWKAANDPQVQKMGIKGFRGWVNRQNAKLQWIFDPIASRYGTIDRGYAEAVHAMPFLYKSSKDELIHIVATAGVKPTVRVTKIDQYMDTTDAVLFGGKFMGGERAGATVTNRVLLDGMDEVLTPWQALKHRFANMGDELPDDIFAQNPDLDGITKLWVGTQTLTDAQAGKMQRIGLSTLREAIEGDLSAAQYRALLREKLLRTKEFKGLLDSPDNEWVIAYRQALASSWSAAALRGQQKVEKALGVTMDSTVLADINALTRLEFSAIGDTEAALKVARKAGIPTLKRGATTIEGKRGQGPIFKTFMATTENKPMYALRPQVEEWADFGRDFIKNHERYAEQGLPPSVIRKFGQWWRQSVVQGKFFPDGGYISQVIFGDWCQMTIEMGFIKATQVSAGNVGYALPVVNRYLEARAAAAHAANKGMPTLPLISQTIINPEMAYILRGGQGALKTPKGPMEYDLVLRTFREEGGWSTFTQAEQLGELIRADASKFKGIVASKLSGWSGAIADHADLISKRQRFLLFMQELERHGDPSRAGRMMRDALYDYERLVSPSERKVIGSIPFYSFWKNALRQQGKAWSALFTDPSMMRAIDGPTANMRKLEALKQLLAGASDDDDGGQGRMRRLFQPEYLDDRAAANYRGLTDAQSTHFFEQLGRKYTSSALVMPPEGYTEALDVMLVPVVAGLMLAAEADDWYYGNEGGMSMAEDWEQHMLGPATKLMGPAIGPVMVTAAEAVGLETGAFPINEKTPLHPSLQWVDKKFGGNTMFITEDEDGKRMMDGRLAWVLQNTPVLNQGMLSHKRVWMENIGRAPDGSALKTLLYGLRGFAGVGPRMFDEDENYQRYFEEINRSMTEAAGELEKTHRRWHQPYGPT